MQFTPLVDFFDDDLKSQYCVGLSYAVKDYIDRDGKVVKAEDSLLNTKVQKWIFDGKVKLGAPTESATNAMISGSGNVG